MEQLAHNQLKETWEQANLQFVNIQDKLKQEIRQLRGDRSASPRYVVFVVNFFIMCTYQQEKNVMLRKFSVLLNEIFVYSYM